MGLSKWLGNLPLRGKFALVSALAALMLALPSARLLSADWQTLQSAQQEARGRAHRRRQRLGRKIAHVGGVYELRKTAR